MSSIIVVPIASVSVESLEVLGAKLTEAFHMPVIVERSQNIDASIAFDNSRNQYYSTLLLSGLLRMFPSHTGKILGVTGEDLYIPVLTYVFGEAQLDGMAAVISTNRLDDTKYGLPFNRAILEERMVKEAVHELGHTFGLVHCSNFECVMHSSTGVEEIDLKSNALCVGCAAVLRTHAVARSTDHKDAYSTLRKQSRL